jgi:hypothetical protein
MNGHLQPPGSGATERCLLTKPLRGPLEFAALEQWEKSVAQDRSDAERQIHEVAERLATV